MRWRISTLGLVLALIIPCAARGKEELERSVSWPEYELTLQLPELDDLAEGRGQSEQCKGHWIGSRGEQTEIEIKLWLLNREQFGFREPDEVTDLILENMERGGSRLKTVHGEYVTSPVGFSAYGRIVQLERTPKGSTRQDRSFFLLGSLLKEYGLCLEVEVSPVANPETAEFFLTFLRDALRYEGSQRDIKWSKAEAERRWNEHAPESARGRNFKKPIRTKHYIILTNSSGGKLFAKKMEECYRKIQKTYPFEEVEGRMLMPVFLFRTNHQYHEFCTSVAGWSLAKARASKGHAWKDYYATWYESPNDPVHIHEATHQIFKNRLRLGGGGSWFQEGLAEYIETSKNARNMAANLVKKGEATPLRELMGMTSLLHSSKTDQRTGNQAGNNYKHAALIIEFLREDRKIRPKFMEFVHAMGGVRRGDLRAIGGVLKKTYGFDIEELEQRLMAHCKKR